LLCSCGPESNDGLRLVRRDLGLSRALPQAHLIAPAGPAIDLTPSTREVAPKAAFIGVHQRRRLEPARGRAREHGQHAEHPPVTLAAATKRRTSRAARLARIADSLFERIPAAGVEDELDRRYACDLERQP
jgi:hypothetical protein